MNERLLKIGEVAEKTGLTNRTLRYYGEIGLLSPAKRSPSGYRLYGQKELERLQKIQSLKYLGLPLEEIRECLNAGDEDYNLENILYRQMKQVRTEIELGKELYRRLQILAEFLQSSQKPSTQDLLNALNTMTKYEKYYTKKQQEYLKQRREKLGEDRIREVQQEWKELIEAVQSEMENGADPRSDRMQQLAARWEALIREFTGGDQGIRQSLSRMYKNEDAEEVSFGYMNSEIMQFVGQALKARGSG